jgi:hypothetical protein
VGVISYSILDLLVSGKTASLFALVSYGAYSIVMEKPAVNFHM